MRALLDITVRGKLFQSRDKQEKNCKNNILSDIVSGGSIVQYKQNSEITYTSFKSVTTIKNQNSSMREQRSKIIQKHYTVHIALMFLTYEYE